MKIYVTPKDWSIEEITFYAEKIRSMILREGKMRKGIIVVKGTKSETDPYIMNVVDVTWKEFQEWFDKNHRQDRIIKLTHWDLNEQEI